MSDREFARQIAREITNRYPMKTKTTNYTTWYTLPLVACDLPECEELDHYFAHDAKTADQIKQMMQDIRTVGFKLLNLQDGQIDAYCLYQVHRTYLTLRRFIFATEASGQSLIRMLQGKGRALVEVPVDEYDLRTQRLFQRNGFRWFSTTRSGQSDVYLMRWTDE